MGILELLIVALMPVVKTLLIAIVGLFLAIDRFNILCAAARNHLNNLVFYVFFPALLGSSLIDSITATNIISLWFTPVSILLTYIIGSTLGWLLVKVTRTPRHLHGLVIGCCAAGNMGNLPVIIIPAICAEKNNPFGDSFTCSRNGMAYVSLSMSIGAVFVWCFVYNIVPAYREVSDIDIKTNSTIVQEQYGGTSTDFLESSREELLSKDCPNSEDCEASSSDILLRRSEKRLGVVPLFLYYRKTIPYSHSFFSVTTLEKIKRHVGSFVGKINLSMLLTPPTIATIIGLLIGISPLRKVIVGDTAPLRVIESSIVLLGEAAIPSMTLIMGANLLKGIRRSGVGLWLIVGIIVIRFIALPLLGVVIIKAAQKFEIVGSDPLYLFVLLLQYSVPPAMAIGTITQLFEIGETECSVIMCWNYAVASIAMTLWCTYFMWFLS